MVHLKIRGEAGDQLVTSWCVQPKLKLWFLTSLQLAICDLQETYGWSEVLCSEQRWLEHFFSDWNFVVCQKGVWPCHEVLRCHETLQVLSNSLQIRFKFASNSLQHLQERFCLLYKVDKICLWESDAPSLPAALRTQLSQLLQKQCGRAAGASMVFWQDSSIVPNGFPMGSQWVPNGCLTGCESRTDLCWWSTGGWRFFKRIPSRSSLSLPVERHVFYDFQQKR